MAMNLATVMKVQQCHSWQERALRASVLAVTSFALLCAGAAVVAAVAQGLLLGALGIGAFQLSQRGWRPLPGLPVPRARAAEATPAAEAPSAKAANPPGDAARAPAQGQGKRPSLSADMKAFGEALGAVRFGAPGPPPSSPTPSAPGRVARAVSGGAALALVSAGAEGMEDGRWSQASPGGEPRMALAEPAGPRAAELRRSIQRLLNRVCPENVGTIVEQLADIKLEGSQEQAFMIRTLFKRAILDPHYCETYADLTFGLYTVSQAPEDVQGTTFSGLIVGVCHAEFEALSSSFQETREASGGCDPEETEFELKKTKDKMLALMSLAGNLFLRGLMSSCSIGAVLSDLLAEKGGGPAPAEHEVECACEVLKSVGATLQMDPASEQMVTATFQRLAELRKAKSLAGRDIYCKRLQFAIQDLIDLRDASWVKKVFKSAAKTKDEIRCDAANEEELKHQGEDGVQRIVAGLRPQTIAGVKVSWGQGDTAVPALPGPGPRLPASGPSAPKETPKVQAPDRSCLTMQLPWGWAGTVIGPRGETARVMQEETGARIWVDRAASQARVSGSQEAVAAAECAIKALLPPPGSPEWRQVSGDEETSAGGSSCSSGGVSSSGSSGSGSGPETETARSPERPRGRSNRGRGQQEGRASRRR